MIAVYIFLSLLVLVMIAAYACYRLAFSVPKQSRETLFLMPDTEQYTPYATLTSQMIRDALAIPYEPVSITSYDGLPLYGKCYLASPKAPWLIINTAIAIVAGLCMFPAIFAFGMEPNLGPSLIFKTMPMVFSQMPFGRAFGTLFFILVLIAAALTAIGFIEAIAGALADATKWKKKSASF